MAAMKEILRYHYDPSSSITQHGRHHVVTFTVFIQQCTCVHSAGAINHLVHWPLTNYLDGYSLARVEGWLIDSVANPYSNHSPLTHSSITWMAIHCVHSAGAVKRLAHWPTHQLPGWLFIGKGGGLVNR
jgi:hypothetical protein